MVILLLKMSKKKEGMVWVAAEERDRCKEELSIYQGGEEEGDDVS